MNGETPLRPSHPDSGADTTAPRRSPSREREPAQESLRPLAPLADRMGDELSDERVSEIRARIASGAYNSREVAEELARRLMESGDL